MRFVPSSAPVFATESRVHADEDNCEATKDADASEVHVPERTFCVDAALTISIVTPLPLKFAPVLKYAEQISVCDNCDKAALITSELVQ